MKAFESLVCDRFLTNENQIIAHDTFLSDIKITGAILKGTGIPEPLNAMPILVGVSTKGVSTKEYIRNEREVSFVISELRYDLCAIAIGEGGKRFWDAKNLLKTVHLVLQQVGSNVEARVEWATYERTWLNKEARVEWDASVRTYLKSKQSGTFRDSDEIYLGGYKPRSCVNFPLVSGGNFWGTIFEWMNGPREGTAPIAISEDTEGYGVAQLFFDRPINRAKPLPKPGDETVFWEGERKLQVHGSDWETWQFGRQIGEDKNIFKKLLNVGDTIELKFRESSTSDDWTLLFFDRHMEPLLEVGEALGVGRTHAIGAWNKEYRYSLEIPITPSLAARLKEEPDRGFCWGLQSKGLTFTEMKHTIGAKGKLNPKAMNTLRQSTIAAAKKQAVLLDGLNIALHFESLKSKALIGIVQTLKSKGFDWLVVFDSSVRFKLKEVNDTEGLRFLNKLERNDKDHCMITEAGTRADECILMYANEHGNHVISCDRYSDYAQLYPWVKNLDEQGRRVHPVSLMRGELLVPSLGLCVHVD